MKKVNIKPEIIYTAMMKLNMTQTQFANYVNMSAVSISEILLKKRNPSPNARRKIMNKLKEEFDIAWDDLFEEVTDENPPNSP